MKVLIETQYKEWYGCEDNVGVEGYGRYKNKGGHDFVINVDDIIFMYHQEDIIKAFNKKHNVKGSWTKCEVLDILPYREPEEINLKVHVEDPCKHTQIK